MLRRHALGKRRGVFDERFKRELDIIRKFKPVRRKYLDAVVVIRIV